MVPQGTADRFVCPNVFKLIMSALPRSTANIVHMPYTSICTQLQSEGLFIACVLVIYPHHYHFPPPSKGAQVVSICMLLGDTFLCTDNSFVPNTYGVEQCVPIHI